METEVGNFRQIDAFDNGASWDEQTALAFFYRFIIPSGEMKQVREFEDAKRIRAGILKWMGSKGRWVNNPDFDFDLNTFNSINKKALETLLNTSLGDLNQNQYFVGSETPEKKSFTKPTTEIEDKEGNKTSLQLAFGRNLGENKAGLNVKDTEKYSQNRNELIAARNELEALKIERDDKKGSGKSALTKKINNIETAIKTYEEMLESAKQPMYNDNITLRQVVSNDPNIESFYSTTTLMPKNDSEKVALGLLREVIHKTIDIEEYNRIYGDSSGLSYEEFKNIIIDKEAEYIKILTIPFIVQTRMKGIDKDSEGVAIEIDMKSLLEYTVGNEEENKPLPSLIKVADEIEYPISMSSESYEDEDISDKSAFIKYVKNESSEKVVKLVYRVVSMWAKINLEPLLNIQTKVEMKETELVEASKNDLTSPPVKMSRDTIDEFLLDNIVDVKNIKLPKATGKGGYTMELDTTKSKFKMPINFSNKSMDFESGYARTIGADSKNVISSEQALGTNIKSKGSVPINYSTTISQEIADKLPGISAEYQWKIIRSTLTNFYRASGKTTIAERIDNKIKSKITRGLLGDLEEAINIIKELDEAQKDDLDKKVIIDLTGFSPAYWFENGVFKFSVKTFREKISDDTSIQSNNLIKNIRKIDLYLNRILDYVEENETELDELESQVNDEEDEEEAIARIAEENKDLISEQKRGEELEERERERDEDTSEGKEALARILSGEVDMDEYEDEETGLMLSTLLNIDIMNIIIEIKVQQRKYNNLLDSIKFINNEIRNINQSKGINIKTNDFIKVLDEWTSITKYTKTNEVKKLIAKIDESKPQKELKEELKEKRIDMDEFWSKQKETEEFQIPKPEDFVRLLNAVNLRNAFSNELVKDSGFNDARHGLVTASSKKLFIEIDYDKRKLYLKGKVDWVAKRESYIGYKISGTNKQPQVSMGLGMSIDQKKKVVGKRVTGAGRVQSDGLQGEVAAEDRLEFLNEIKSAAMVLIGAVNQ